MITLCIPTYNRPHYLGRLLQYYKELKFPYPIIVADSSNATCRSIDKKLVLEASDILKVSYQEYEPNISVCVKISKALSSTNSEFACICADDDFVIPDSITQCASFLELNPDYSVAHGNVAMALLLPPKAAPAPQVLHAYTYAQLETKEGKDITDRLKSYFNKSGSTFYSVYRRANLISNLTTIDKNTNYPHFGELLLDCLNLIQGKLKCLDILYMVRQLTPERGAATYIPWHDFIHVDYYAREYDLFFKCLTGELVRSGITEVTAKEIVSRNFSKFRRNVGKKGIQTLPSKVIRGGYLLFKLLFDLPVAIKLTRIRHFLTSPRDAWMVSRCENDKFSVKRLMHVKSDYHKVFSVVHKYLVRFPGGIAALKL